MKKLLSVLSFMILFSALSFGVSALAKEPPALPTGRQADRGGEVRQADVNARREAIMRSFAERMVDRFNRMIESFDAFVLFLSWLSHVPAG